MSVTLDLEPEPEIKTAKPPARKPSHRGRNAAIATGATVMLIVAAIVAYAGVVLTHPLPATAAVVPAAAIQPIDTAPVAPAWPAQGSAAVGLVGQPGLLGSHGSDASVPIASMTKTITALVLLNKYQLKPGEQGPTVTFGQRDVDILSQVQAEDGSWATVQSGEKLTLTQAMTVMMLASANNYARSLAVWSYGSQPNFEKAANTWLTQHGFTHTHMTDPSGLDPGSVSNLTDLVGIGELAIANPVLAKIVNTRSAAYPVVGQVHNTDPLIGKDGIEGVKTGYTEQAGHCLLFAAKVTINGTERTLVGVMLHQPTYDALWTGVPKLLTSFEQAFHEVDLTGGGATVYATYRTPWGGATELVAATQPTVEVFSANRVTVKVAADKLVSAGAQATAGTVTFSYGGKDVVTKLTTTSALGAPTRWWKLTHPRVLLAGGAPLAGLGDWLRSLG